jgi:hypothetical protein
MLNAPQSQVNKRKNKKVPARESTRKKPGSTGRGEYYHIEVRSAGDFVNFQTQDVGRPGHIQRVAGRRPTGYWATVKWLIGKEDAHVQGAKLVADTKDARDVIEQLGSQPVHVIGDRFKARPRAKIPEKARPTSAQTQAPRKNVKKARAARTKKN